MAASAASATAGAGRKRALRARRRGRVGLVFLIMTLIAVVMLYPFWYLLDNAFRNQTQFNEQRGHSTVSWHQLLSELPVGRELLNSTLICLLSVLLILAVSTTAGFAFAFSLTRFPPSVPPAAPFRPKLRPLPSLTSLPVSQVRHICGRECSHRPVKGAMVVRGCGPNLDRQILSVNSDPATAGGWRR